MNARAANEKQLPLPRRAIIVGFMGAGKSSVARELARHLSCEMIDLDELITAREGRTPQEIIERDGESRFRDLETVALHDALERSDALIISTGGGTWTLACNRALIAEHSCLTIWLDAPFELCWLRIASADGSASRPLARDRESARQLYDERRAHYRLSDFHVCVSEGRNAEVVAGEIAALIRGECAT
jgi:shikimate kinase